MFIIRDKARVNENADMLYLLTLALSLIINTINSCFISQYVVSLLLDGLRNKVEIPKKESSTDGTHENYPFLCLFQACMLSIRVLSTASTAVRCSSVR